MEWLINKQSVICENSPEICEYTFPDYGKNSITIHIKVASGQNYTFEKELSITEPLKIERHIKVTDKNGLMLNEESTYDRVLRAYVLRNTIIPPDTLTFDARDVISANPGYTLDTVLWKISNSKTTEERRGTKINIDFNQALRYTIECVYSFKKTGSEAIEMAQDTVIVDIERKSLTPRMDIHMSSDYVPSLISVDASLSESEKSEIKKFIFDF